MWFRVYGTFVKTDSCTHNTDQTAGRGLQPRPKRLFSGVGKYFGRGCKPRPADSDYERCGKETRLFFQDGTLSPAGKSRVSPPSAVSAR
ncbi:Uncharacterized protein dnm_084310 [Desulfonema magnum]|uniref:Uncharacterized protein n=1 Tax=Desulfonema magnum TaxID=45655 RepID=A0A975GSV9_9BACT|nr:Uncharacterized protein dnm_084310 [Desulfonema magnum]